MSSCGDCRYWIERSMECHINAPQNQHGETYWPKKSAREGCPQWAQMVPGWVPPGRCESCAHWTEIPIPKNCGRCEPSYPTNVRKPTSVTHRTDWCVESFAQE